MKHTTKKGQELLRFVRWLDRLNYLTCLSLFSPGPVSRWHLRSCGAIQTSWTDEAGLCLSNLTLTSVPVWDLEREEWILLNNFIICWSGKSDTWDQDTDRYVYVTWLSGGILDFRMRTLLGTSKQTSLHFISYDSSKWPQNASGRKVRKMLCLLL